MRVYLLQIFRIFKCAMKYDIIIILTLFLKIHSDITVTIKMEAMLRVTLTYYFGESQNCIIITNCSYKREIERLNIWI